MNILLEEDIIKNRLVKIGKEIEEKYKGKEITLVVTLKGAFITASELVRNINGNVRIEFIKVSSYVGTKSSGDLKYTLDLDKTLSNKNIIIIEDIIDTGLTLYKLKEEYIRRGANVEIMALLDKPSRREYPIEADYVGFKIEDRFVVGYGLDYNELFRELPYVAELEEKDIKVLKKTI